MKGIIFLVGENNSGKTEFAKSIATLSISEFTSSEVRTEYKDFINTWESLVPVGRFMNVVKTIMKSIYDNLDCIKNNDTIIFINQPEWGLYPMYQSHISNLLFDIYDYIVELSSKNLTILCETHSEYIIGRSQAIVKSCYDNKWKKDKCPFSAVYYFKDSQVKILEYDERGHLETIPGFSDELFNTALMMLLSLNGCR